MTLTFQRAEEKIYDGKLPLEPVERYWIYSGEWMVGWIARQRFCHPSVEWQWTFSHSRSNRAPDIPTSGAKASLEEAQQDFCKYWEAFLQFSDLAELPSRSRML